MSRGFARGFDVGFNAVDSVIRQRDEKEERDRRNKRDDEKWSFEKEKMERERSKAVELAAAGQAPKQGKVVNGNFASGAADQAFLADQEAAIAEMEGRAPKAAEVAAGAGNQVMGLDDPRAQDSRQGYLARVADVQRRHGDVAGSLTTEELGNRIAKEGYKDAIDYILAGGDPKKAQAMFNNTGKARIDGELIATPTKRVGANGVEMPDMELSVRDAQGNVRKLGSALQMRFMADNPAEYMKLLNQEMEGGLRARGVANQEKATEASIRQGDRRLYLTELQVRETIANNAFERNMKSAKWADEKAGGKLNREIAEIESVLGRKLTGVEKLAKLGLKPGEGKTEALVNDMTKEWQKQNPDATPAQVAEYRADMARQVEAAPKMLEIEARIKAAPPEQRAAMIAEAKQRFGATDEWLKERGLEVPAPAGPQGSPALDGVIEAGKRLVGRFTGGGQPAQAPVPAAPSPAQTAVQATGPEHQMYLNSVAGLRAAQQDLARKMQGATPEQQAELNQQIMALGAEIAKQKQAAAQRGIQVE